MCAFLCVSVVNCREAPNAFRSPLSWESALGSPFGTAAGGDRPGAKSFVVLENGCSCSLVGLTHKNRMGSSNLFLEGLGELLEVAPAASVLIHTFRSDWRSEAVRVKRKLLTSLGAFRETFPRIEEDVRYAIKGGSSW